MSSEQHTSPDCAKLPLVQASYSPKGTYEDLSGFNTYTAGPAGAKGAVLLVYDVFGIKPQILQGADLIASQGFRVYMPDLFRGEPIVGDWSDERKAKWRGVGTAGYCWGWKMIRDCPGSVDLKGGVAGCHPSGIAASDAQTIQVPVCLLPSSGENIDIINQIYEGREKALPGRNFLRLFGDSAHGWMAARADLEDPEQAKTFGEGYQCLVDFFGKNISL